MPQEPRLAVVDASVVLKWQLNDEEFTHQAIALRNDFYISETVKAIAPSLLLYEVMNGIVTAIRRKRLASDKALEAMNNLLKLGVELKPVAPERVLTLALRHNLSAYDAAYLALAEAEGCELWTGDRQFYQAVRSEFSQLKWLGDYIPTGQ
jgi:predicted nucleic acid-binding protein